MTLTSLWVEQQQEGRLELAQGPQHDGNGARAATWNKVQRSDGRSQRPRSQVCTQEN